MRRRLAHLNPRAKTRALLLVVAALLGVAAGIFSAQRSTSAPEDWMHITCDVGQGSAALLRAGEHSAIIIDTGDDPDQLLDCLRWAGITRVEAVLLTHNHSDHVQALGQLLTEFTAPVYISHQFQPAPPDAHRLAPGTELTWTSQRCTLTSRVLAPGTAPEAASTFHKGESADENNASLVTHNTVKCKHSNITYLATGDIEEAGVTALSHYHAAGALSSEIISVPHHGSKGSGTSIYRLVSPRLALISAGRNNDYGHPHAAITEYLATEGIPVQQTASAGHIAVSKQGNQLVVYSSK